MIDPRSLLTYGAAAAVIALGGLALWQRGELHEERASHMRTQSAHAEQLRRLEQAAREASTAALRSQEQRQQAVAALDERYTRELTNAQADNDLLRTRVRSGEQRLRIAASCPVRPASTGDLPSTASTASVDDGTTVELSRDAGEAALDTLALMKRDRAKLAGLQAYVAAGCKGDK